MRVIRLEILIDFVVNKSKCFLLKIKLLLDVHQCSPVFFLLNIVYFSVCLTSNKLYWIDDQLADVSTRFYTSASWSVGELTVIQQISCLKEQPGQPQTRYSVCAVTNPIWHREL